MSAIPINPSDIAGAIPYTASLVATPLAMYKPPREGAACVPMQFNFSSTPAWLVNMGQNVKQPLSQVVSLYVDATQSSHDINILFPDTGYQARVNQGGSRFVPVLTRENIAPLFYVLLDSSGATSVTDLVNIFALNVPMNAFESDELSNVLSYGYGQFYQPQPLFTQSAFFEYDGDLAVTTPQTLIPNNLWYITSIYLSFSYQIGGNPALGYVGLYVNSATPQYLYKCPYESSGGLATVQILLQQSGLQLTNQNLAGGAGALYIGHTQLQGSTPTYAKYYCSIGGGILKT